MKCPNCGYEQPDGATECLKCQVIFSKWETARARDSGNPAPPVSPAVEDRPAKSSAARLLVPAAVILVGLGFLLKSRFGGGADASSVVSPAAENKHISNMQAAGLVDRIAKEQAAQNMPNQQDPPRLTPDDELMQALRDEYPDSAETALKRGANANMKDPGGFTILMYAAKSGSARIAKLLIQYGADVSARVPPAGASAQQGKPPSERYEGATALMVAALAGNSNVAKALLEAGANPRDKDEKGRMAWHYAQSGGSYQMADDLKKLSQ